MLGIHSSGKKLLKPVSIRIDTIAKKYVPVCSGFAAIFISG
jgi:hypothetical protein